MVHRLAGVAGGIAFACVGAFLFWLLHLPLPFILGSMIGAAFAGNMIGPLVGNKQLRRAGQLILGVAVGGVLTADTASELVNLLPWMIVAAVALNVTGFALSFPIAKIARVDRLTAMLSCLPAGLSEMSSLARDLGAKDHVVATIHALRVTLILALLPIILDLTNVVAPHQAAPADLSRLWVLVGLFVASGAVAYLASRLGMLNPWVVVPMSLGLVVVSAGGDIPVTPSPLIVAAQIAVGASLGARFDVESMSHLPRAVLAGVVSTLCLATVAFFLIAPLISWLSGLDPASSALGVSPGGLGEMIASAKALGLASASVAGFQFVRSLITNALVAPFLRWVKA